MPRNWIVFNGKAGEAWVNDTGRTCYQFFCRWQNTCGVCAQNDHAISPRPWPILLHRGCNCWQVPIRPGGKGDPFVDFREVFKALPESERRRAIGASNWRLIEAGKVKWEDVVTPGRVRPLTEVIRREQLTREDLKKAGIKVEDRFIKRVFDVLESPEQVAIRERRQEILERLKRAGMDREATIKLIGEGIVGRVGVGSKGVTVIGGGIPRADIIELVKAARIARGLAPPPVVLPAEPKLPTYGESKAEVVGFDGDPKKLSEALGAAKEVLGRDVTPSDLASLAGAPDGAKVQVEAVANGVYIHFEAEGVTSARRLRIGEDGKPEIYNGFLEVAEAQRGKGIGRQILGRQIEQSQRLGIARMQTLAGGDAESAEAGQMNGYMVWPKFGYDGRLDEEHLDALPAQFRGVETIQELYSTREGRQAWERHGSAIHLEFDLSPDSDSLEIWNEYQREKERRKGQQGQGGLW